MAVSLTKGERISLEKTARSTLTRVMMGLGWDAAQKKVGFLSGLLGGKSDDQIDLDASCIMFDGDGNVLDTVWFRQLASRCRSITHSGDNLTGEGDGDDETISVDLTRLPAAVQTLVFTVNSFRGQPFDDVANAFCRLVDSATGKEIARYTLSGGGRHTGMVMAKMIRTGAGWDMQALGEPGRGKTFDDMLPAIRGLL